MGKKKLQHFAENKTFAHYFEMPFEQLSINGHPNKGYWKEKFFANNNPLIIEIGCGKGEYTVGQAKYYPNKNFIGIDIKGARIWRGARTIRDEQIKNAAFIRSQAGLLEYWFAENEVDEIWITFPDPQPGCRKNKRLTSLRYLNMFRRFLAQNGIVHLKTDSAELFDYTIEVIAQNNLKLIERIDDLYAYPKKEPLYTIQTYYENMWLEQGEKIKYLSFSL
jgi:tRNA (guanine-N7-)-methyltransferase